MVQANRQKRGMPQSRRARFRSDGNAQGDRSGGEVGVRCSITWPQVAGRLAPFVGQMTKGPTPHFS